MTLLKYNLLKHGIKKLCLQVWNKLLRTCNNLVDIMRVFTRLCQQGCYNHDIRILVQPCVVTVVTVLFYHDCIRVIRKTL